MLFCSGQPRSRRMRKSCATSNSIFRSTWSPETTSTWVQPGPSWPVAQRPPPSPTLAPLPACYWTWARWTPWGSDCSWSILASPFLASEVNLRVSLLLSPSKNVVRAASSLLSTPVVPQPTVNSTLIKSSFSSLSSPPSLSQRKCFDSAGLLLSSCSDTPWTSSSLKYSQTQGFGEHGTWYGVPQRSLLVAFHPFPNHPPQGP